MTQSRLQKLLNEYRAGRTSKELAAQYGVSRRLIQQRAQEAGIKHPRGGKAPPFSDTELQHLIRDYLDRGLSPAKLAGAYGHGSDLIRRELLLAGVPLRPRGHYARTLTDAEEAQVAELYLLGATCNEIAQHFGPHVDKSLIAHVLERQGVPRRTMAEARSLRNTWKYKARESVVEWP